MVTPELRSDPILRPVTLAPINPFVYINVLMPVLRPILKYGQNVTVQKVTVTRGLYCNLQNVYFHHHDSVIWPLDNLS